MTLREMAAQMESGIVSDQPSTPETSGDKTSYMVASAAKALKAGQALGAQVLIVDPPRKGLEDEVVEELCKPFDPDQPYAESPTYLTRADDKVNWTNDVQTLIYVSCGFDALARDCEKLLNSRAGWMLESATGYVLFPGSDHVETLCVFRRS
jgi:tRNA/tmRNA/rRNA uracil-C5-methylase (TrmA/RlmC/RlmD family)